jgi:hypothetical protein
MRVPFDASAVAGLGRPGGTGTGLVLAGERDGG